MEQTRFWSRVGHWFKAPRSPDEVDSRDSATQALLDDPSSASGDGGLDSVGATGQRLGLVSRLRPAKRSSRIERMQAEQTRVVHLVESVQRHLEAQGERSESIARSLETLANSMSHLPDASKAQIGLLERVSEEMTSQVGAIRRLEDVLSQLPPLADAQRESIVSLERHVESSRQTNESVTTALGGVRDTISACGESATASVAALKELRREYTGREERLAVLLEVQNQRLQHLTWLAIAAGVAALVTGVVGLIRFW